MMFCNRLPVPNILLFSKAWTLVIVERQYRLTATWAEVERLRVRNLTVAEGTGHVSIGTLSGI